MAGIAVGFAGAIASGKSTISTTVADARGWSRVGFGDYVRGEARRRGLDDTSREVLQALGESLIDHGWRPFCEAVLGQTGWQSGQSLVIDGIRHVEAVRTLRSLLAPMPFVLIFLQTHEGTLRTRRKERGIAMGEQRRIDAHSTEVEVTMQLTDMADLLTDADRTRDEVVADVLAWLVRVGTGSL